MTELLSLTFSVSALTFIFCHIKGFSFTSTCVSVFRAFSYLKSFKHMIWCCFELLPSPCEIYSKCARSFFSASKCSVAFFMPQSFTAPKNHYAVLKYFMSSARIEQTIK